jgi:hypothetical protein
MEPDGHPATREPGLRTAVAVNKRHPSRELQREYITSDISIRER